MNKEMIILFGFAGIFAISMKKLIDKLYSITKILGIYVSRNGDVEFCKYDDGVLQEITRSIDELADCLGYTYVEEIERKGWKKTKKVVKKE